MSALRWRPPLGALIAVTLLLGAAGPPPKDPDWPCVQRLVPNLTAGTFWAGHGAAPDWQSDPAVVELVDRVAPRSRPADAANADLKTFALATPAAHRAARLERVFTGLVDQTNAQRLQVIERLRGVARRQRDLTGMVAQVTAQLRALPADASETDREEVTTRRQFLIRDYEEVGRTIRYACEVPVQLEARLGSFAQTLQASLQD